MKRKILYISYASPGYKTLDDLLREQEAVLAYKKYLALSNHVTYLTKGGFTIEENLDNVNLISEKKSMTGFFYATVRFASKHKPDIVIIHGLDYFLHGALLKILAGVRVILQHHGEKTFNRKYSSLWPLVNKNISAYFFNGRGTASPFIAKKLFSPAKIFEVTEGTCDFSPEKYFPSSRVRGKMVMIGRLDHNKNHITFLRALSRIRGQVMFTVDLYYSTAELEQELKLYCKDHELTGFVNFIGSVPHEQIEKALSEADLFVSCSLSEGSGYSLIEALACGTFPVVSEIAPFQYLLNGLDSKRIFPPLDDLALSNILMDVLNEKLEEPVREKLRSHFNIIASPAAIARQVENALSCIL